MSEIFLTRLAGLIGGVKPLWGKVSAQHMAEHLLLTIQMRYGKIKFDKRKLSRQRNLSIKNTCRESGYDAGTHDLCRT